MDRREAIEIIKSALSEDQLEELQAKITAHQEGVDLEVADYGHCGEEAIDELNAFVECLTLAEDWASQDQDKEARKQAKKDLRTFNAVLIQLGVYQPITEEHISRCSWTSGTKDQHFPLIGGQRYETVMTYEQLSQLK